MNVLVVGGAGYVGGAVTDALLTTDHCIRVYDALLYEESYRKPVDFVFGDVRDQDRLLPHLKWADAVIWLAAIVGDGACQLNPEITIEVNQEAVGWMVRHFDRRIIFMSTCSVYGAQDNVELTEDSPTAPLSMYAASKLAAETYLRETNAITFRLGHAFWRWRRIFQGAGWTWSSILSTVRAWQNGKISVFGGDQFRPLLHVKDAAQAAVDNLTTTRYGHL